MSDDVQSLARALADEEKSSEEWGNARSRLWKLLEADLKSWIKNNPPGTLYKAEEPMGAFYAWYDGVLDGLRGDDLAYRVVDEVLSFSKGTWEATAKKAIASLRSKARGGEKERVAEAHPRYPELLKEIREAKRAWKEADAAVKQTHAFRMMGGLARMGLPTKGRHDSLVQEAQRMEKGVLGKILTSY